MNIELKSLKLTNFKGIKSLTIPFSHNMAIYGDNGTGKTTIADAFLWLLFGKNTEDAKDFGVKTLRPDGSVIHRLEHEVEGVLLIEGQETTLKRTLKEKWVKRRGEEEEEFTGHETSFFINDVPYKAGEYQKYISDLIDEKLFKLITNPDYFNSLPWTERRETLVRIAGEVSDEQIAEGNPGFMTLLAELATSKKTLEDCKKQYAAEKKKLKDELELIPARIDELKRNTPEQPDLKAIAVAVEGLMKKIAAIDKKIEDQTLISKEALAKIEARQKEISAAKIRMQEIRTDEQIKLSGAGKEVAAKIQSLKADIVNSTIRVSRGSELLKQSVAERSVLEAKIEALRKEWDEKNAEELIFDELESICPTCLRELQPETIEENKAKMTANFNAAKLEALNRITERGKKLTESLTVCANAEANNSKILDESKAELNKLSGELKKLESLPKSETPDIEAVLSGIKEYTDLQDKIEILSKAEDVKTPDLTEIKVEKFNLNQLLDAEKAKLAVKEQIEKSKEREAELLRQEKEYAQQIADLEKREFIIAGFTKAKIDAVTGKINALFSLCQFKMFNTLINGGVEPCCETMVNGVPYSDLNNGGRINAGREIISVLNRYYFSQAPVFTDNAESVTELFPLECQTVNLVVSEKDKKLRIE